MSCQLQCGEKNVKVSKQFILMYTFNFRKNKEAFVSEFKNNSTTNNKMRKCDLSNIDQALLEWF